MKKLNYKTEIIIGLQNQGYYFDFILQDEFLKCLQDGALISPDDFEIAETYIFHENSYAQSPQIIYAINSAHNGIKGIMMLSYSKFIKGLSIHLWAKFAAQLKLAAQIISIHTGEKPSKIINTDKPNHLPLYDIRPNNGIALSFKNYQYAPFHNN